MQVNSINTYDCSGCGRKPQVAFGIGATLGEHAINKKADLAHGFNAAVSADGPKLETNAKDAFSRLDAQKPVKKRGIKNFIKRIFKR